MNLRITMSRSRNHASWGLFTFQTWSYINHVPSFRCRPQEESSRADSKRPNFGRIHRGWSKRCQRPGSYGMAKKPWATNHRLVEKWPSYDHDWLVVSTYPSEKYEFVNWDDELANNVPSHQPNHIWGRLEIYSLWISIDESSKRIAAWSMNFQVLG